MPYVLVFDKFVELSLVPLHLVDSLHKSSSLLLEELASDIFGVSPTEFYFV